MKILLFACLILTIGIKHFIKRKSVFLRETKKMLYEKIFPLNALTPLEHFRLRHQQYYR